MASKYEHPFRVQAGRLPTFKTQHHAYDFLAEYQAGGHIRLCAHARGRGTDPTGWDNSYAVVCDENSFAAGSTATPGVANFYRP